MSSNEEGDYVCARCGTWFHSLDARSQHYRDNGRSCGMGGLRPVVAGRSTLSPSADCSDPIRRLYSGIDLLIGLSEDFASLDRDRTQEIGKRLTAHRAQLERLVRSLDFNVEKVTRLERTLVEIFDDIRLRTFLDRTHDLKSTATAAGWRRPSSLNLEEAHQIYEDLYEGCRREVEDLSNRHSAWLRLPPREQRRIPSLGTRAREYDKLVETLAYLDLLPEAVPDLRRRRVAEQMNQLKGSVEAEVEREWDLREQELKARVRQVGREISAATAEFGMAGSAWGDPEWAEVSEVSLDESHVRLGEVVLPIPDWFGLDAIPVMIDFPAQRSLAIGYTADHRDQAVSFARSLILRTLLGQSPGQARLTLVDPVGIGQSVSEFLHISDYDPKLVDTKPWTSERDIEQKLNELCAHVETVISKYLRGQFADIREYNQAAHEVAEPYRIMVVFDYPSSFSEKARSQLLRVIENGPRCGVVTVLLHRSDVAPPEREPGPSLARIIESSQPIRIDSKGTRVAVEGTDSVLAAPVTLDQAPPLTFDPVGDPTTDHSRLLALVGKKAKETESGPVRVSKIFSVLARQIAARRGHGVEQRLGAPSLDWGNEDSWWTATTANQAIAPLGITGANDVAALSFSSTEVAGGAIVIGMPRSGKTTALHCAIATMCALYGPDELELYLIDSKHGVEFKTYEALPHARMVSINSEREFALAILESIATEVGHRADLMKRRTPGRANLSAYREATGETLPRIVVVMDEFHVAFEEDDRLGRAAFAAFSNIIRQGPFAGIHLVVASQTLSNTPALDRNTLMLLPQRVAFMSNEVDAELVMGDGARDVRLLSRSGEGVLNAVRGELSHNKPFQGAYLSPEELGEAIGRMRQRAESEGFDRLPRVYDGDSAGTRRSTSSTQLPSSPTSRVSIDIGEPFSLEDSVQISFRRSEGSNALVLGQLDAEEAEADLAAVGLVHSVIRGLRIAGFAIDVIDALDAVPPFGALSLRDLCEAVGVEVWPSRSLERVLDELLLVVRERLKLESYKEAARFLVLNGLGRLKSLSPEAAYHYGDDGEAVMSVTDRLREILIDGPDVGVHVVVTAETLTPFDRRVGRDFLSLFDLRAIGSSVPPEDVATCIDEVRPVEIRTRQLLLADASMGEFKRLRGYPPLVADDVDRLFRTE